MKKQMKRNKIIYTTLVLLFIFFVVFALYSRANEKERNHNITNKKEYDSVEIFTQKEITDLKQKKSIGIPLTLAEEAVLINANIMSEDSTTPATLEECYARLNIVVNKESKDILKNSATKDLILFNFEFGMWIRNFWIYPTYDSKTKISKFFLDQNITEPDEMSYMIIIGYFYHLNGINIKTIKDVKEQELLFQ
jgi:hypothetical protein